MCHDVGALSFRPVTFGSGPFAAAVVVVVVVVVVAAAVVTVACVVCESDTCSPGAQVLVTDSECSRNRCLVVFLLAVYLVTVHRCTRHPSPENLETLIRTPL